MKLIIVVASLIGLALASEKGYPAGFMGDCPGMNRTTSFSEATKKSQYVVVMWPKESIFSNNEQKCKLGAKGAACVAKHIDIKKSKILVLISGYLDGSYSPLVRSITVTYLDQGYNVIVVETFPVLVRSYPIAARVTKPLGSMVGDLLAELTRLGLEPSRLEMVGGSLGAHIATYASMKYHNMTGYKPARLTGEYQPAMAGDFLMPCFLLCSHIRSAFYWVFAQRNPDKFVAVQCDSLTDARSGNCYNRTLTSNILGPNTDFNRTGIFYLPIAESMPFYLGSKGKKYRSNGINNFVMKIAPDRDMVV